MTTLQSNNEYFFPPIKNPFNTEEEFRDEKRKTQEIFDSLDIEDSLQSIQSDYYGEKLEWLEQLEYEYI